MHTSFIGIHASFIGIHALKGQKLLAQGIALGIMAISNAPCKGKSFVIIWFFEAFALTGRQVCKHIYPGRCPGLGASALAVPTDLKSAHQPFHTPVRRPDGFEIRRKKSSTYQTRGFVIPLIHNILQSPCCGLQIRRT